jgi:hypothetical protein
MSSLSISTAWNETAAFVKREAGLLFPIALAFLALPSIVVQYFVPAVEPGQQPQAGAWMLWFIPLIVLTIVGSLAITTLALRSNQSVQEAIAFSLRRFLPVFGAALLMTLIMTAIVLPALILIGLAGLSQETMVMLSILVVLAVFTFLWIRLMLMTPVGAAEPVGPVAMLKRSWQLTAGHTGKLIGFATIVAVVGAIAIMAATLILGTIIALVAGRPDPGSLSYFLNLIVSGIASAVFSVYFTVAVARIYAQLAGGSTSGI